MDERERRLGPPPLSAAPTSAARFGLTVDPKDRVGLSMPPPEEKSLPFPRLLVSVAGLTGGLVILFSVLKATSVIG